MPTFCLQTEEETEWGGDRAGTERAIVPAVTLIDRRLVVNWLFSPAAPHISASRILSTHPQTRAVLFKVCSKVIINRRKWGSRKILRHAIMLATVLYMPPFVVTLHMVYRQSGTSEIQQCVWRTLFPYVGLLHKWKWGHRRTRHVWQARECDLKLTSQ
jgi:hypothetical protein